MYREMDPIEIPGCEILQKEGETSRAIVWQGLQRALDRKVCVRVLKPDLASDPICRRDFIRPARAASKLKHPNLVQIYDVADYHDTYYVMMEHVQGKTLRAMIKDGVFPQKKAMEIAGCVADALGQAWSSARIVHRNLKPDNIMIDEDGTVKIADISLATVVDPEDPSTRRDSDEVEGTPSYMSPEQITSSRSLDFRSDMYGLGATLYHMLTGKAPFDEFPPEVVLEKQLRAQIPNPRDLNPSITLPCVNLLIRLMMKKPEDRFPSWEAATTEIRAVGDNKIPLGRPPVAGLSTIALAKPVTSPLPRTTQAGKTGKRRRFPLAAVVLWLLLLAWFSALGYLVLRPEPLDPSLGLKDRALTCIDRAKALLEPWRDSIPVLSGMLSRPETPTAPPSPPAEEAVASTNETVSVPPPGTPAETPPPTTPPEALDKDFKLNVARSLVAGDYTEALAMVRKQITEDPGALRAQLDELHQFVLDVSQVKARVTSGLMAKVGEQITIEVKGKIFNIVPRAMATDKISAILVREDNGVTQTNLVTFTVDQLDPIQQSRWIGAADTTGKSGMKCLLYMRGGDYASAKVFAEKCGILSDSLVALSDEKTAAAPPP
jgi:serine/threonine protein kinase